MMNLEEAKDVVTTLLASLNAFRTKLDENSLPTTVSAWLPDDITTPEFAAYMGFDPADCGATYMRRLRAMRAILIALEIPLRYDRRTSVEMSIALQERGLDGKTCSGPDVDEIRNDLVEHAATPEEPWEATILCGDVDAIAKHIELMLEEDVPTFSPTLETALQRYKQEATMIAREGFLDNVDHGLSPAAFEAARGRYIRHESLTAEDEDLLMVIMGTRVTLVQRYSGRLFVCRRFKPSCRNQP